MSVKRNKRRYPELLHVIVIVILLLVILSFAAYIGIYSIKANSNMQQVQCQVLRPFGPYSALDAHIEGNCNAPQKYVAYFNGTATGFANYIFFDAGFNLNRSFTISFWMYPLRVGDGVSGSLYSEDVIDLYNHSTNLPQIYLEWRGNGNFNLNICNSTVATGVTPNVTCMEAWKTINQSNRWIYITMTYDNGNYSIYMNGTNTNAHNGIDITNFYLIHPRVWFSYILPYKPNEFDSEFYGYLSNIQIYNTSLSQTEVHSLYIHGINGTPINIQNLMGWWPLNGNANDYSGNGNNGIIQGVTFVSNRWLGKQSDASLV